MVRVEFLNFIVVSVVIIVQIDAFAPVDRNLLIQQTTGRICDADQMDYKLTRFELKLIENSNRLISEFLNTNRRLRALENKDFEVETALKGYSTKLGGCKNSDSPLRSHHEEIDEEFACQVDSLVEEVQLVVAALRTLNSSIVSQLQDLPSKKFLIKSLSEINQRSIPRNQFSNSKIYKSCKDIMINGQRTSGSYQIQPEHASKPFFVWCNMDTIGGGWTTIQRRYDGSQDFYLNWNEYKTGFGNIVGEHWLGLENIHQLTGYENTELLVELVDGNSTTVYAHYAKFEIGSEVEGFSLKNLGEYTGNAGDSLRYQAGSAFTTKDHDQDHWTGSNCAQEHSGAWWYTECDSSNLNGKYLRGYYVDKSNLFRGMYWSDFRGPLYSLAKASMMVR